VDVFKYLSDMVASIKRLGSILAGDEVGDGWSWQRVALYQAHEMRHYAEVLERVAAGKHGGGIVFPSWDEGGDGVTPAAQGSAELLRRYQEVKSALASAIEALKDNDVDESMGGEFDVLVDALNGTVPHYWKAARDIVRCELVPPPMSPDTIEGVPTGEAPAWGGIPPVPPLCCLCNFSITPEGDWLSGHNAEPVAKGRCCRRCNDNVVVPARLREFMHRTAPKS
jgi:hypothetical protein